MLDATVCVTVGCGNAKARVDDRGTMTQDQFTAILCQADARMLTSAPARITLS